MRSFKGEYAERRRKAALYAIQGDLEVLFASIETSEAAGDCRDAELLAATLLRLDALEARERQLLRVGTQLKRKCHETYCHGCGLIRQVKIRITTRHGVEPWCANCSRDIHPARDRALPNRESEGTTSPSYHVGLRAMEGE